MIKTSHPLLVQKIEMLPTIDQGAQVDDDHEHPAVLVSVPINSDSYATLSSIV